MVDGETPSWLDGADSNPATLAAEVDTSIPAPSSTPAPTPAASAPAPAAPTTDNVAGSILTSMNKDVKTTQSKIAAAAAVEDEKDLPKLILFMRILNMAAAVLLITCSVIELVRIPPISVWITAIYASCGGLLVCCLETQLKYVRTIIAMNFGFLFNSVYRFLFYCLIASVTWSYGNLLGKITAITLGVVAVFNTYILCRYPTYRKMREKVAEEEDKRVQAKINQQVRKQAISQMGWGKN